MTMTDDPDSIRLPDHVDDIDDAGGDRSPGRNRDRLGWASLSLREYLGLVTIGMLVVGLIITGLRLRRSQADVARLRAETGHLTDTDPGQIAAARAPSDQPLTYRIRVRTPSAPSSWSASPVSTTRFRVAYSSLWPKQSSSPRWYGAVPVPPGESLVTVRIHEDPRDHRWKISTAIGSAMGTRRMATVLPEDHVGVFKASHDVISTGVGRETLAAGSTSSIRLLDERWLVGEGSLLLYGDKPPDRDQIGVYAELQPDVEPL